MFGKVLEKNNISFVTKKKNKHSMYKMRTNKFVALNKVKKYKFTTTTKKRKIIVTTLWLII